MFISVFLYNQVFEFGPETSGLKIWNLKLIVPFLIEFF